jgi:hypothetical protein
MPKRILDAILDIIARGYLFVWAKVFQRQEPFTPQLCRMEKAWPAVFWALVIGSILFCDRAMSWGRFWPSFWAVCWLLFMLWFTHHVVEYRAAHPANVPYALVRIGWAERVEAWAVRRIEKGNRNA